MTISSEQTKRVTELPSSRMIRFVVRHDEQLDLLAQTLVVDGLHGLVLRSQGVHDAARARASEPALAKLGAQDLELGLRFLRERVGLFQG